MSSASSSSSFSQSTSTSSAATLNHPQPPAPIRRTLLPKGVAASTSNTNHGSGGAAVVAPPRPKPPRTSQYTQQQQTSSPAPAAQQQPPVVQAQPKQQVPRTAAAGQQTARRQPAGQQPPKKTLMRRLAPIPKPRFGNGVRDRLKQGAAAATIAAMDVPAGPIELLQHAAAAPRHMASQVLNMQGRQHQQTQAQRQRLDSDRRFHENYAHWRPDDVRQAVERKWDRMGREISFTVSADRKIRFNTSPDMVGPKVTRKFATEKMSDNYRQLSQQYVQGLQQDPRYMAALAKEKESWDKFQKTKDFRDVAEESQKDGAAAATDAATGDAENQTMTDASHNPQANTAPSRNDRGFAVCKKIESGIVTGADFVERDDEEEDDDGEVVNRRELEQVVAEEEALERLLEQDDTAQQQQEEYAYREGYYGEQEDQGYDMDIDG